VTFWAAGDLLDDLGGADDSRALDEVVLGDAAWLGAGAAGPDGAAIVGEPFMSGCRGGIPSKCMSSA
jgi:hypothetical protein